MWWQCIYYQKTFCRILYYMISTSFMKDIIGLIAGWVYVAVVEILVSLMDQVLYGLPSFQIYLSDAAYLHCD